MAKLILMSIIFATVLVPATAAKVSNPKVALQRCVLGMLISNLVYLIAVLYLFPRLQ
jgi:hypothetical protein